MPEETPSNESAGQEGHFPEELLTSIVAAGGGRVVLVAGAGCSKEDPTSLPLSDELARRCHQQLVDSGVLSPGTCSDPNDLSAVADAVFNGRGTQKELVDCFPPSKFEYAEPNDGHELAAALLREGAVSCIMTLNFDLAFGTALSGVSAGSEVTTVRRPADYDRLGSPSLVYLHRPISSPADELILRTSQIEEDWQGAWEEAVAQRVVGGPITVFAGLGTPAAVLVETTQRIREKIADRAKVFIVDPGPREASAFFAALDLNPDAYIKLPWTNFMRKLAERLGTAHRLAVEDKCRELLEMNKWDEELFPNVCERIADLGLIGAGRVRATWLLRSETYAPHPRDHETLRLLADLILAVAMVERLTGMTASLTDSGVVEFDSGAKRVAILVGSAGGSLGWSAVETRLNWRRERLRATVNKPTTALVGGMPEFGQLVSTPESIAGARSEESVVAGASQLRFITTGQIRGDPNLISELVA